MWPSIKSNVPSLHWKKFLYYVLSAIGVLKKWILGNSGVFLIEKMVEWRAFLQLAFKIYT